MSERTATPEEIFFSKERAMIQPLLSTLNDAQLRHFRKIMRWCSASERAAVQAETERCAKLAEVRWLVMPLAAEPVQETLAFARRCIAAAIRQKPDEGGEGEDGRS